MSGDDPSRLTRSEKPERESSKKITREPDFGARYKVLGTLGKGGMGEVFRAFDNELDGEVALKIVNDEQDASLARFRREIALSRKVTNPNVLRVYDLGEHEGLRFLSMEYVDGEDLGAMLKREGRLSLERALALFRQVCVGLAAAHEQGVVHRDLKPQNVLVDKADHVRVADFGIARSIGDSGLTATGAQIGSPAYMSPEQVKGDATDERSDIYSLGVMLYQLVGGATPFQAPTPHAVMEMRLHKTPKPLREVEPATPAHIDAICARCLALDPAARYPSVLALLADFDRGEVTPPKRRLWPYAVVGAAIAATAVAVALWPSGTASTTPPAPVAAVATPAQTGLTTVLVYRVENRAVDPSLDALDDVFLFALRRSHTLDPYAGADLRALAIEVSPDSTALDGKLARSIASHLGRKVFVLEGFIAHKGAGFAITITATNAETGAKVFSNTTDAASTARVVPTIGRLAAGFRAALGDPVPDVDAEKTDLSPVVEADHEHAVARGFLTEENYDAALPHLLRALELDPEFVIARCQLAILYSNLNRPVDAGEQFAQAFKLADRLGDRTRLKITGDYYQLATGELDRAIVAYKELVDEFPGDIAAEINLSTAYQSRGDTKNAIAAGEMAVRDHPHDQLARTNLVNYHVMLNDYDGALLQGAIVIADFAQPGADLYRYMAFAATLAGRTQEADDAYRKFAESDPPNGPTMYADRAMAEGRYRDAVSLLENGIADARTHSAIAEPELKQAMLAEAKLLHGDKVGALAAAAVVAKETTPLYLAAIVEADAGDDKRATANAARLDSALGSTARALAKLVLAELSRVHGKPIDAITKAEESLRISDQWVGHLTLGRALLDAGRFEDAARELAVCEARAGEGASDPFDTPFIRRIPLLAYYIGRAQEGLGDKAAAHAAYEKFVAGRAKGDPDPLVADARKRLAAK